MVATLNYSGILNSPFEFYSSVNDPVESKLSSIFEANLNKKLEQEKIEGDF